jgi:hypothetical protein
MTPADQVECRSDQAYIGYPVAFYWQGNRLQVARIISESHHPAGYSFEVLTQELGQFELIYDMNADQWSVLEQGANFATQPREHLHSVLMLSLFCECRRSKW